MQRPETARPARRLLPGLLAFALFAVLAMPVRAQLVNGSFETGDLTGWTRLGFLVNAGGPVSGGPQYSTFAAAQLAGTNQPSSNFADVLASQTSAFAGVSVSGPAVLPTDGLRLAYVSNEKSGGDNTLTGASLAQTFTVPNGARTLTVDLMLLNSDASGNFSRYDDFGGVALLSGGSVVAQYNIDLASGTIADQHIRADAPRGGFANSTDWTLVSFDVSAYAGQSLTLVAYTLNYGGDNLGETRLVLDNVRFQPAAVPALSGTLLGLTSVLLALAGAWLVRRR